MREEIQARLLRLNREFYQTFAPQFSQSRQRLQPGVLRALRSLTLEAAVLDLGCGNGQLARELARRGFRGRYVGLDASQDLLAIAREIAPQPEFRFLHTDLSTPGWNKGLIGTFDQVFAFAFLHHLPGQTWRQQFVGQVRELLGSSGKFALSVWNFMASERMRARLVPWQQAGLGEEELEAEDYLLDWRRGGRGLRYVHYFTLQELNQLAAQAGYQVLETYHADGEGGRLGRYQVWTPHTAPGE